MIASDISELIHNKYESAIKNGDLKLTESTSKKFKDSLSSMQYYVNFAPSLASKPEASTSTSDESVDPFANPDEALVVSSDLNGDGKYQLLLNKYPVVPEHTLLVTKEFEHQNSVLTPEDLMLAYKYICKMDDEDENIRNLVFYNSGPASGSSQNHKHLQSFKIPNNFIPFQDKLCHGRDHFLPNIKDEPLQDSKVSFAHFVLPLPESSNDVDEDLLAMCYISLLQRALTFFQDWLNEKPNLIKSYNVLLTKKWICVVPRSNAKSDIKKNGNNNEPEKKETEPETEEKEEKKESIEAIKEDSEEGEEKKAEEQQPEEESLELSINATGYAGFVLAKTQEDYDKIVANPDLIDKALFECGFPSTAGKRPNEYNY